MSVRRPPAEPVTGRQRYVTVEGVPTVTALQLQALLETGHKCGRCIYSTRCSGQLLDLIMAAATDLLMYAELTISNFKTEIYIR
eukprot:6212945-Pleurochrysis_carterae.AAC.6